MRIRSLPHFSHKPIGKTTHKKGMSYSHVNYITRDDACSKTLAENMPADRDGARPYFEREAAKEGVAANARIADTFIIALPLELTREQRHEAIARFMQKIGHGRIAWLAAFHDLGKDEHNPHCHLILRDADIETDKKVIGTTTSARDVREAEERGWRVPPRMTTKDLRKTWCEHLNAEMERHGLEARFDQRTLKQQGIDREAEIHVGPKAHAMAKKDRDFFSQDRRHGDHTTIYTLLDAGSRADHNERIKAANRQRAADLMPRRDGLEGYEKRELRKTQMAERKLMYDDQKRDRATLREAQDVDKLAHQRWARGLYAGARQKAYEQTKTAFAPRWKELRKERDATERSAAAAKLKAEQKQVYAKHAEVQVAQVRPIKDEAWQSLKDSQQRERDTLKQRHLEENAALARQHMAERHALHERWQQHHLTERAARISTQLEGQSMPRVQATAVKMIKLHVALKAQQTGRAEDQPVLIAGEVSRLFDERGRAEAANRASIRYELNASRQLNQLRAADRSSPRRTAAGQMQDNRARNRSDANADRQRREARNGQKRGQQALLAGRTLTTEERANAPPDVRAALASLEKRAKRQASFDAFLRREAKAKGRDGGRTGR